MSSRKSTAGPIKGEYGIVDVKTLSEDGELSGAETARLAIEIDSFKVLGLDADDAEFYAGFSEEQKKRVVRKVRRSLGGL